MCSFHFCRLVIGLICQCSPLAGCVFHVQTGKIPPSKRKRKRTKTIGHCPYFYQAGGNVDSVLHRCSFCSIHLHSAASNCQQLPFHSPFQSQLQVGRPFSTIDDLVIESVVFKSFQSNVEIANLKFRQPVEPTAQFSFLPRFCDRFLQLELSSFFVFVFFQFCFPFTASWLIGDKGDVDR